MSKTVRTTDHGERESKEKERSGISEGPQASYCASLCFTNSLQTYRPLSAGQCRGPPAEVPRGVVPTR